MSETTTRKCCGCHGGYHDSCAAPCECPGGPYDPTPPTPFAVVHRQVGADVWAVRHRNGWDAATLHDPREAEAVADLLNAMRRGGPTTRED